MISNISIGFAVDVSTMDCNLMIVINLSTIAHIFGQRSYILRHYAFLLFLLHISFPATTCSASPSFSFATFRQVIAQFEENRITILQIFQIRSSVQYNERGA